MGRIGSTGYNKRLAKVAVQCSADTFVVNQSLVLRINICGENRHLRQAPKRCSAFKMTRLLTITIILTLGLSCSTTKEPFTYEICVRQDADTSMIVKNELIGIADTTTAFLSGQVINLETKETLWYANVSLKDKKTEQVYGQATDSLGQFSITVPANDYEFEVNYVGYSSIKQDFKLGTGEMREMSIELGQGGAFVTYEIKSDKKLNRRQLDKKAKQLKKEK
jgi:hypothetical protein